MNILFVYNSPIIPDNGGVQRVTYVLARCLEKQGHCINFLSLHRHSMMDNRQYVLPQETKCNTATNIYFLSDLLIKLKTNVIINQDGLNPDTSQMVLSSRHDGISIISVAHNSITGAVSHFRYSRYDVLKSRGLSWLSPIFDWKPLQNLMLWLFRKTHASHFQSVINGSDKFVLLSERFYPELEYVTGGFDKNKVMAISNPCTIESEDVDFGTKQKILLYVGRIDFSQKRNDLLLKIWQKICCEIDDWKLVIVGGGSNLDDLKQMSLEMGLRNVDFVGQASPLSYYKKASLFALTSAFEGFPLTLVEAMANGVVPYAFDSYASLRAIIDDGQNGCVIDPFDLDEYSRRLLILMKNDNLRRNYAMNALEKSKVFSVDSITEQWLQLLKEI